MDLTNNPYDCNRLYGKLPIESQYDRRQREVKRAAAKRPVIDDKYLDETLAICAASRARRASQARAKKPVVNQFYLDETIGMCRVSRQKREEKMAAQLRAASNGTRASNRKLQ